MSEQLPPSPPIPTTRADTNTIVVRMDALASGGSSVGTVLEPEPARGKKAFIAYTIPGETVIAKPVKQKKSLVHAELVSIQTRSSLRVEPPCPYFGQCGGCDLQHIELSAQRELKAQMVHDLLNIHGGLKAEQGVSILGAGLPGLKYRRRMSFHINKKREFGLYKKHGRHVIEIDHCAISTDTINRFLAENLELVKECAPEIETVTVEDHAGETFLLLEIHPRNESGMSTLREKDAFRELERRVPNIQVNFHNRPVYHPRGQGDGAPPVGHFSQNNELANAEMITCIQSMVTTERVTDLYAGAGNISIPLAQAGRIVTAVELNPHLVEFGRSRAAQEGLTERLTFHSLGCEKWIEKNQPDPTIVLDPPRSGALEVCERLDPTVSPRLVYVSCYPPTFTRDAAVLCAKGYTLQLVKVLDMFPQTYHSELVALFETS